MKTCKPRRLLNYSWRSPQFTFPIGSCSVPYSCRKREKRKREKEQERGERFVALKGPKIAPHTLGLLFNSGRARERRRVRTHNMDGGKRGSTETQREEEKAAVREQVGQRIRTWRKMSNFASLVPSLPCSRSSSEQTDVFSRKSWGRS